MVSSSSSHTSKKPFLTGLLMAAGFLGATGLLAGFVAMVFPALAQAAQASAAEMSQSIPALANLYHGQLSRPIFPEISLGLPLWIQAFISLSLIAVMAFISVLMPKARRLVMVLTLLCILRHLAWRAFDTLNFNDPWLATASVGLLVAECLSFFTLAMSYFQIWRLSAHQDPAPLPDAQDLPAVDVFVCTLNEPVSVLYRTLIGCRAIDYPHKNVYLCDDGRRPEMQQLAEHLGVGYITRENNTHAKAGNLNHAMKHSNAPFVLVFDADHVPVRSFIKEVIGFFAPDSGHEKLAFIQTPQHFFTLDPFQRNLIAKNAINNEQDLFFHVIEPGNDAHGATFFAGSGAIFRREALEGIGGFAVETLTEDVHTGLRLHAQGWKSLYYNKDLSAGLAQDSFVDFVNQRLRWARGMVQILFHDNPAWVKGLNLGQRLCYMAGIWHFLSSWPRIIFMVSPLIFLLFGLQTINAGFIEVLVYYAPSFVMLFLGYALITGGMRQSFWSEVYETATCVYFALTNLSTLLIPAKGKFRVTPKEGYTGSLYFHWQIVLPQLVIASLTIIGIGMAVVRLIYTPEYAGGVYTNMFWAFYNLVLLVGAIYVAQERPQYRLAPRIDRQIPCELMLLDGSVAVGKVTNLSESGVGLEFSAPIPLSGTMALKILDFEIDLISTTQVQAIRSVVDEHSVHSVGCRLVNRTDEQHQQMIQHMFSAPSTWTQEHLSTRPMGAFANLVQTPMRVLNRLEQPLRRRTPRFTMQMPCAFVLESGYVSGVVEEISETGVAVILPFHNGILQGQSYPLLLQWPDGDGTQMNVQVARIQRATPSQNARIQKATLKPEQSRESGPLARVGVNFVGLTREQRLSLIQHLFQSHNGPVRVAPAMARIVECSIYLEQSGQILRGVTQEISEMGVRVALAQAITPESSMTVTLHWENGETMTLPAVAMAAEPMKGVETGLKAQGAYSNILFFQLNDLKTVEALSKKLHASEIPSELAASLSA